MHALEFLHQNTIGIFYCGYWIRSSYFNGARQVWNTYLLQEESGSIKLISQFETDSLVSFSKGHMNWPRTKVNSDYTDKICLFVKISDVTLMRRSTP